jgi:transposase InsO family protein
VEQEKAVYPVRALCRVLGVSPSGYWAWRRREPSARAHADAQLTSHIVQIHQASRGTYGAPRIHAELAAHGTRCGRKRVARLMRLIGIAGCHRRRTQVRTTRRDPTARPAPDLVQRAFVAAMPNELWVSDITYVPTEQEGFLFLAVILDVFSRRVVGWSMAEHLRAELVLAALEMAIWNRHPTAGLIHHSDHGCQYTATAFEERCRALGIQCSMGTTGDCYDNALAESFFATLECELLDRRTFQTHEEARSALFAFIESFYNRQRRHSALGYLSPEEYERRWVPPTPVVA